MPEDDEFMSAFTLAVRQLFLPDDSIMERATPRWEYRKCRKFRRNSMSNECLTCTYNAPARYCQGPYLYLYWKEKGKLHKKYIGKGPEEYLLKKIEKCYSQYARLGNLSLLQPSKSSSNLDVEGMLNHET